MKTAGEKPRIVFLYASAGGGHRSVAEALVEAMQLNYGDAIDTKIIDVLKGAPKPFDKVPEAYSQMIRNPQLWKQFYDLGDGQRRAKMITSGISLYTRKAAEILIKQNPADLYVSVYHFANAPVLDYLKRHRDSTPFATVVTDLTTTPPVWYDNRVDLCVVPTEYAKNRALELGMDADKVKVVGLPISYKFTTLQTNRDQLRQTLGWPAAKPIILIMAGSDGVGPLYNICKAITKSGLDATPVIVTGRNERQRKKLESTTWPIPVFVYGFVKNIDQFMQASDIFVTKAGPTNIVEAFTTGLPIILYSRIPGQEEGNIDYVTMSGAGVWAPTVKQIISVLSRWIEQPVERQEVAANSLKLANPKAADTITKLLISLIKN